MSRALVTSGRSSLTLSSPSQGPSFAGERSQCVTEKSPDRAPIEVRWAAGLAVRTNTGVRATEPRRPISRAQASRANVDQAIKPYLILLDPLRQSLLLAVALVNAN